MPRIFGQLWMIILVSLSLLTLNAKALGLGDFEPDDCLKNAQSNLEMRECAGQSNESAQFELSKAYQELVTKISKAKSAANSFERELTTETLNRLERSQTTWLAYREATCSFESAKRIGGTSEANIVIQCEARLTKLRVDEIRSFLQDEDEGL